MRNQGKKMNNPKTPITGIVDTDKRTYAFYLDNYTLRFLDTIIMCVEYSQKVKKAEHPDKSSVKSAGNEEKYSTCMFSQKK